VGSKKINRQKSITVEADTILPDLLGIVKDAKALYPSIDLSVSLQRYADNYRDTYLKHKDIDSILKVKYATDLINVLEYAEADLDALLHANREN
jgi:hypothetical protein